MKKAVDDKRKICHVECQNWKTKWRWILTSLVNLSMIHLRNYYVPLRDLCPFHLCQLKVTNLFKIFLKYAHVSYFHHFTNWNVQFWVLLSLSTMISKINRWTREFVFTFPLVIVGKLLIQSLEWLFHSNSFKVNLFWGVAVKHGTTNPEYGTRNR